jgi:hypothetical protein
MIYIVYCDNNKLAAKIQVDGDYLDNLSRLDESMADLPLQQALNCPAMTH